MGLTPSYAAPETVAAFQAGSRTVVANAAVDAWALGVIAFELLVKKPAFGAFCTREDLRLQLLFRFQERYSCVFRHEFAYGDTVTCMIAMSKGWC